MKLSFDEYIEIANDCKQIEKHVKFIKDRLEGVSSLRSMKGITGNGVRSFKEESLMIKYEMEMIISAFDKNLALDYPEDYDNNIFFELKNEMFNKNTYAVSPETMIENTLKQCISLYEDGIDTLITLPEEERMAPFLSCPDEFVNTTNWIKANLVRNNNFNWQNSSYNLRDMFLRDTGVYVTNGMFICAMMAELYRVKQRPADGYNLNGYFNVTKGSVNALKRRNL